MSLVILAAAVLDAAEHGRAAFVRFPDPPWTQP
jgi:hypothetical protein